MADTILIIGFGNSLRRDDGAGLILAERLEHVCRSETHEVRRISVQQLTPELAADISYPEIAVVLFVDACVATKDGPSAAVQIRRVMPQDLRSSTIGHQLSPEMLLLMAHQLYKRTPPAWIVTVPGKDFSFGLELSPSTKHAIDGVQNVLTQMFA